MAFDRNETATEITMHAGDTGAFKIHASRGSGTAWTEADRMLMTIKSGDGTIVLQRLYRLDDQWGLGDGWIQIEFHNDDTDEWEPGQYAMERRYDINPRWTGTPPDGRCVNALTAGVEMIEGDVVRTKVQGTVTIIGVHGKI